MPTAEDKLRWILEVLSIPNQLLSLAEKATLIMARFEIDATRHEPDRGNRTTIYVPNIAERNGLSHDTVGSSLKSLAEKHIIEREVYRPMKGDSYNQRVAIALPELLILQPRKLLATVELPQRNHGGKRVAFICKSCRAVGYNMQAGMRCICQQCGEVHFYASSSAYLLTREQVERME